MNTRLYHAMMVCCLCLVLAANVSVFAQTENSPRDFAELLKPIPQQDFLKLRGNKKVETAMAMSKTLVTNESQKPNTFKLKVTKVETHLFPEQNITGWLISSDCEQRVKVGSVSIPV